jgi:hypothetical protein
MGHFAIALFLWWTCFQVSGSGSATGRSRPHAEQEAQVACHDGLNRQCRDDHAEGDAGEANYTAMACSNDDGWWSCSVDCTAWCQDADP